MSTKRTLETLNQFDADMEEQSYIVDEIMIADVIELTGITPVDSVQRMHREESYLYNLQEINFH